MALALLGPLASLADWTIDGIRLEASGGRDLLVGWDDVWSPTWNTAYGSVLAASVSVAVVLPAAYLVVRHRSRIGNGGQRGDRVGVALPGILIGLALLFWTLKTDIGSHLATPCCCWCCLHGALRRPDHAHLPGAVAAVSSRLTDAARTLGARWPAAAGRWRLMPDCCRGRAGAAVGDERAAHHPAHRPVRLPTLTTKAFNSIEEAFVAEARHLVGPARRTVGRAHLVLIVRRAEHFD